jgi:hypothetical protein
VQRPAWLAPCDSAPSCHAHPSVPQPEDGVWCAAGLWLRGGQLPSVPRAAGKWPGGKTHPYGDAGGRPVENDSGAPAGSGGGWIVCGA